MERLVCVVIAQESGDLSVQIPTGQAPEFYALVAGAILRSVLETGASLHAVMEACRRVEGGESKLVPEPMVIG